LASCSSPWPSRPCTPEPHEYTSPAPARGTEPTDYVCQQKEDNIHPNALNGEGPWVVMASPWL
jgi:hypothetical protein